METTTRIHEAAAQAAASFTTTTRGHLLAPGDEETITTLQDNAPEWVRDLVRSAHDGSLPDDWRYASIRSALDAISDNGNTDLDHLSHEWADSNVDIYNDALIAWLGSHATRPWYCDEAVEEFGTTNGRIMARIAQGQHFESLEVFQQVLEALTERVNSDD